VATHKGETERSEKDRLLVATTLYREKFGKGWELPQSPRKKKKWEVFGPPVLPGGGKESPPRTVGTLKPGGSEESGKWVGRA